MVKFSRQSTDIQVIHESCPHQMLFLLLGALCTVQMVCLSKLAVASDNEATREASFRRIQRVVAQMVLDLDAVARYLKSRIPSNGPYTLTMGRTNWKSGEVNITALVLGMAYDHMSFPILFMLLPKRWNSNCKERINMPAYGNIKISLTETLKKYPLESPNIFGSIIFTPSMAVSVTSIIYSATLL